MLGWQDSWGYRNVVTSKKEIKTAADLKGLKIRMIETPTYVAALNAMGASATPMAFGEVYTALQTGVLDGFEHAPPVVLDGQILRDRQVCDSHRPPVRAHGHGVFDEKSGRAIPTRNAAFSLLPRRWHRT